MQFFFPPILPSFLPFFFYPPFLIFSSTLLRPQALCRQRRPLQAATKGKHSQLPSRRRAGRNVRTYEQTCEVFYLFSLLIRLLAYQTLCEMLCCAWSLITSNHPISHLIILTSDDMASHLMILFFVYDDRKSHLIICCGAWWDGTTCYMIYSIIWYYKTKYYFHRIALPVLWDYYTVFF